jgi:hypothetical protein
MPRCVRRYVPSSNGMQCHGSIELVPERQVVLAPPEHEAHAQPAVGPGDERVPGVPLAFAVYTLEHDGRFGR